MLCHLIFDIDRFGKQRNFASHSHERSHKFLVKEASERTTRQHSEATKIAMTKRVVYRLMISEATEKLTIAEKVFDVMTGKCTPPAIGH